MADQSPASNDGVPVGAHPAGPLYESGLQRPGRAEPPRALRRARRSARSRSREARPAPSSRSTPDRADDADGDGRALAGADVAGRPRVGADVAAVTPRAAAERSEPGQPRRPPPPPQRAAVHRDDDGSSTLTAGHVLAAGLLALVLAALLNADQLVRDAERKPFGTGRDVSLAVWEPLQSLSGSLGLTEPRRFADEALGRDIGGDAEQILVLPSAGDGATVTTIDPTGSGGTVTDTSVSGTAEPDGAGPTTSGSATTVPTATTTPEPTAAPTSTAVAASTTVPVRIATPADPVTLWVGGDSMAQVFGESLVRLGADTGVIEPTLDYRISSGLTRPDFFNWPARLVDVINNDDPEVMVMIFGANDAQGMELSNGVFQPFEDEWVAEYSTRVGFVMDIVTQDPDRVVLWVGQPIMRSDRFDSRMNRLNQIYAEQARLRPSVVYIDTRPLFSNGAGEYEAFLPALDGEIRNLRQQDGTHLSRAGGDLLADHVLDVLADHLDIHSGRDTAAGDGGG